MAMKKVTNYRWECREETGTAEVDELAKALRVSLLTARVLGKRGVRETEAGHRFLQGRLSTIPDPMLLRDMEPAVARLSLAIRQGEPIAVHGDYDVDGISGTALLVETLRRFGASVEYYIPLRLRDGYGLSCEALERAVRAGARVAVSVDCGVSALAEAELAARLGLDLIITDHHQVPAQLPQALAVVNPCREDCPFPEKNLSGVGVAFMLLIALRARLRGEGHFTQEQEPDLRNSLDLVALGTIADIVPLTGLNRTLVKYGLDLLCRGGRPGVDALKQVAAVDKVSCGEVGFRLAPRLNAAGRLEDAALGVDLLLESSGERALQTARELDRVNRERQALEQQTLEEAVAMAERELNAQGRTIVLAAEGWHPGVIGIVASRLVERYHRPTVMVALENGQGKGSARSIGGFHLFRALDDCRDFLEGFGGHACAAGLTINAERIRDFSDAFEGVAQKTLTPEQMEPRLLYDGEVFLSDLAFAVVEELSRLAPFGMGNPRPQFVARRVRARQPRKVGSDHLRFVASQANFDIPCIAFGMAERQSELGGEIDLLFTPQINEWNGNRSVQLLIKDFRPAG